MKHRDDQPSTYHAMVGIHDPLLGGKWANHEPRHHVGSKPVEDVPRQPGGSPWRCDPCGPEEPLGVAVDAPIDIGWPSPSAQPCSSPGVAVDGRETFAAPESSPTVVARRSPQIRRRA
jgi:hypothetical protein